MLSEIQVNHYMREGFVVPDYRLSHEIIDEIKAAHDRLIDKHPEFRDYCGALLIHDLTFLNYAKDPTILDMVAQLIGENIALWNSSLFAKPAKNGTQTP